ncbi:MAG TPA: hypothetical protein VGC92_09190 [Phenylobacterium sp.]|jgi:hypothetical protein
MPHALIRFIPVFVAVGAALALAACADYGYGGGPRYATGYGYDTYYDDAYGPYYGGYWDSDGVFVYSQRRGGPFVRDEAHHFRHDAGSGYHGVRADRGGHDRDRRDGRDGGGRHHD